MHNRVGATAILVASLFLGSTPASLAQSKETQQALPAASLSIPTKQLANGFYLVRRIANEAKKLEPLQGSEALLADDYRYLEPAEREPVRYLVLQTEPFIPLILAANPKEDREETSGKPRLQLELDENQKGPLEEFTRTHLGETVAIVVGGDIVTTHKIKSAITGGRVQVTRCTEHGCDVLYTRLLKKNVQ